MSQQIFTHCNALEKCHQMWLIWQSKMPVGNAARHGASARR